MTCPQCGAEYPAGDKFCEECGARLDERASAVAEPTCADCGTAGSAIDAQGFCTRCGCERKPSGRDHIEVSVSARLAGVSDRGAVRHRNEDSLALASVGNGDVLVVCDGVSSSQNAAEAAAVAAEAACRSLAQAIEGTAELTWDGPAWLATAIAEAQAAVREVPFNTADSTDPPETTIVAAVRQGDRIAVGWVGDSRAYLLDAGGTVLLTHDHSWMNEMVEAGTLSAEAAALHPQARSITRTLGGPESAQNADQPSIVELDAAGHSPPVRLLLCSDGFWECVPDTEQLAVLCSRDDTEGDAASLARRLVAHAYEKDARDRLPSRC